MGRILHWWVRIGLRLVLDVCEASYVMLSPVYDWLTCRYSLVSAVYIMMCIFPFPSISSTQKLCVWTSIIEPILTCQWWAELLDSKIYVYLCMCEIRVLCLLVLFRKMAGSACVICNHNKMEPYFTRFAVSVREPKAPPRVKSWNKKNWLKYAEWNKEVHSAPRVLALHLHHTSYFPKSTARLQINLLEYWALSVGNVLWRIKM